MNISGVVAAAKKRSFSISVFVILFIPVMLHSVFNIALSPVLTGSMRPVINPGDMLITHEAVPADLHVGDIVVLRNSIDYSLFAHRIINISFKDGKSYLETKGDANPAVDAGQVEINPQQSIPHVIGRIPWVGRIIVYFTNHKASFLAECVLLLFAIFGIFRISAYKKKREFIEEEQKIENHPSNPEISDLY